jgi:hypothetical protein
LSRHRLYWSEEPPPPLLESGVTAAGGLDSHERRWGENAIS